MDEVRRQLDLYYYDINQANRLKSDGVSKWIHKSRKYDERSDINSQHRNKKNMHPVRIKQRHIYVVDFGKNVGREFQDIHLGLVIQNDRGNLYSDNVIVLPITEYKSDKQYHDKFQHKICNSYFEETIQGGLDKDPSKVKIADITTVDKARVLKEVGTLNKKTYKIIIKKLCGILDISIDNLN